jgi:hypothetical protein
MARADVADFPAVPAGRAFGVLALVAGGVGLIKAVAAGISTSAKLAMGLPAALVLADVVMWALLAAWLFAIGSGLLRHEFSRGQAWFVCSCGLVAAGLYLALVLLPGG